jgi:hypothetical protein
MLAFTDTAFARLCIAASRIDPRRRRQWLQEIATKLDPPGAGDHQQKQQRVENGGDHRQRTPAARRQARVRARRRNGQHVYKLEIADRAMEGLLEMMLRMGRLSESDTLDHGCIETALARLLEEQGARWSR